MCVNNIKLRVNETNEWLSRFYNKKKSAGWWAAEFVSQTIYQDFPVNPPLQHVIASQNNGLPLATTSTIITNLNCNWQLIGGKATNSAVSLCSIVLIAAVVSCPLWPLLLLFAQQHHLPLKPSTRTYILYSTRIHSYTLSRPLITYTKQFSSTWITNYVTRIELRPPSQYLDLPPVYLHICFSYTSSSSFFSSYPPTR